MRRFLNVKVWSMLIAAVTLATLALGALPASAATASSEGTIALKIVNPPAGDPWLAVQWQDSSGVWHNVDAWTGPLYRLTYGAEWAANGYVTNWVDPADFDTGPFRWVLYDREGGQVIGLSDSFTFPSNATDWVWSTITVSATPLPAQPPSPWPNRSPMVLGPGRTPRATGPVTYAPAPRP